MLGHQDHLSNQMLGEAFLSSELVLGEGNVCVSTLPRIASCWVEILNEME
jgi:hypothetical protein